MTDDITITTCLYDIRAKEGAGEKTRTISDYFELGRTMLKVRLPLVVYTDNQDVADEVMKERQKHSLEDKTKVVWLPFEETAYYADIDALRECMKKHELSNWNREKDTPLYVILNNNKFDFLQRTMSANPYASSFFFWMDYGIQHCAKAPDEDWCAVWEEWPDFIRKETELVHHLRIHTVMKPDEKSWKDYFKVIYHHIAGSMFGGHEKPLRAYASLFQEQWRKMLYEENWWQLDEAVMTIVVEENPEMFRLWYGDYDGLITNFIHSKRSWKQVFQTLQRYLDAKDYTRSEKVLSTLDEVMTQPREDHYFQWYLTHRCTNDYYRWKKCMSKPLCALLCANKLTTDGNHRHVRGNLKNLRYYNEPCAMKFLAQWVFHDPRNKDALIRWKEFHTGDESWIPLGNRCLSALAMEANHMKQVSLPLDYLDALPNQVLKVFRRQFEGFYNADTMTDDYTNPYGIWFENFTKNSHTENETNFHKRIERLYGMMEDKTRKAVFLHTTEASLMRPFTKEEILSYDQELIATCAYIQRNFPLLDFVLVVLLTNREITVPDEVPERMIVLSMDTPYAYAKHLTGDIPDPQLYAYREGVYEWLRIMTSPP